MADYTIRHATPDDAEGIIAMMKIVADEPDNGTTRASAADFDISPEDERALIADWTAADNAVFLVAVVDNEVIAMANAHGGKRGGRHSLTFGIAVAKPWRGKGIGTALLKRLIDWCRDNPTVKRLDLEVFNNNHGAIRLYERLGFKHEGVKRSAFYKHGEFLDTHIMGMVFDKEISHSQGDL